MAQTPEWEKWRHVLSVDVWEAVALSLNIEPDDIRVGQPPGFRGINSPAQAPFREQSKDFNDRLFITNRSGVGQSSGLVTVGIGRSDPTEVLLPRFALWALSIGWEIPAELAEIASPQIKQSKVDRDLSTRERRTLLTIIAALCKHADIDYAARGAAQRIKESAEEIGVPIDDGTISKVLTQIPDALEVRKN